MLYRSTSLELTILQSLKFASLIHAAGFPPGVVNVLSGDGPSCGAALAAHKDVRRLSFTGSTATGRIIQEIAAKTNFKTVSLEMGGKSASLIFADADLEKAAMRTAASIGWLAGQTCYANSRILVEETCAEKFLRYVRS